ncbi:histidinol dehydrogenase [Myroides sp. LJL119]
MIKLYNNPCKHTWAELVKREGLNQSDVSNKVQQIINQVKKDKDQGLRELCLRFDGVDLKEFKVSNKEIEQSLDQVDIELKKAIELAYDNIWRFHQSQVVQQKMVQTTSGVVCFRKSVAIQNVGLYIPGGSAVLFSTLLMLGIPARIAGCTNISITTPCDSQGKVNPILLYVANLLGIDQIYKVGGAQGIAALAYGTQSIKKVDKIFGPGNRYVTTAKQLVQLDSVAIDLPAGPSEVLVIADRYSNPEFVAADLLSQCEHGVDSQCVLLSNSVKKINQIIAQIEIQLQDLPRKDIIKKALQGSFCVCFKTLEQCFDFSNTYAPEHLILNIKHYRKYMDLVVNAGSVFLGAYACESAGDYASGTNHTLPTSGLAKSYSGVSVDSFVKKISFQHISKQGIVNLGPSIEIMAMQEGLQGHKNAVSVRLKTIENEK